MSEQPWKPGIAYPPDDPRWPHNQPDYRIWVNAERTILLRIWTSGAVEIAQRDDPGATWGPPIRMEEEQR